VLARGVGDLAAGADDVGPSDLAKGVDGERGRQLVAGLDGSGVGEPLVVAGAAPPSYWDPVARANSVIFSPDTL
jgi:hypothetical protein